MLIIHRTVRHKLIGSNRGLLVLLKSKLQLYCLLPICLFVFFTFFYVFLFEHLKEFTITKCNDDDCQHQSPSSQAFTPTRKLPNVIIVGVRKCGTRALIEFLNIHPNIHKAIDEVHFFDDNHKFGLGLEWYRRQMPVVGKGSDRGNGGGLKYSQNDVVIEKTPAYFITDQAPERIYSMNSSIKIIVIVRDPVTRLVSDYTQIASKKGGEGERQAVVESFEDAVLLRNGRINANYKAVRISMYSAHFAKWMKLFPLNQIHVVDGDQFVYDPYAEVKKVESFLGVPEFFQQGHFIYNITKGFYCVRLDGVGVDNSIVNSTSLQVKCLNKSKGRRHPTINPLVIRKLRRFYQPYNEYFYQMIGKRFAWPTVV